MQAMRGDMAQARAAAIVDLFQNALIYTTVLRNIDVSAASVPVWVRTNAAQHLADACVPGGHMTLYRI